MPRRYAYIGPPEIKLRSADKPSGVRVRSASDVLKWIEHSNQQPDEGGLIAATFVIDTEERLLIADRHSEHVACSGGGEVLSAGEVFFLLLGTTAWVEQISNQSTGYCPEPESWEAVATVLDRIGLQHPGGFTSSCIFRRCGGCGSRNIVKDEWFYCDVCGNELSREWNF